MQAPDSTSIQAGLLERLGDLSLLQQRLLWTAAFIAVLTAIRWAVLFVLRRRTEDVRTRYYWRKAVTYTVSILGLFLIGRVWLPGVGSVATFLGLLGAGIAVALKDALQNLAGWLFILWRRPFGVGDRIEIGDTAGDVIDLRIFQFTLLEIGNWVDADQSTGRLVHVPNGKVFTEATANYTRGFPYIWNEIAVLLTFESNWESAKEILRAIAARHAEHTGALAEKQILEASRRFMIFYSTLKPTVYTSVEDSGVLLTIRYLCEVRHRRGTTEAIWEDVLREFSARDDIDFAYPTVRYYDNVGEGKPGARAGKAPA
ncbi:MAG: mechanosensitive ion channel [Gemmatimonadota bacterium]|jgi:small-conductance mechanosensitive channel